MRLSPCPDYSVSGSVFEEGRFAWDAIRRALTAAESGAGRGSANALLCCQVGLSSRPSHFSLEEPRRMGSPHSSNNENALPVGAGVTRIDGGLDQGRVRKPGAQ